MQITSITTSTFKSPLKTPFKTALRTVTHLEDIVVIITTKSGLCGYGEGAPTAVITGESLGTMQEAIKYISSYLIDLDVVNDFETIQYKIATSLLHNTTAKSAVEIAIYDLISKYYRKPLFAHLGGRKRSFQTDLTISLDSVDKMVSDSLNGVLLGYTTLKIKLGKDTPSDIERVKAIKNVIPKDISLRLDANQGWSVHETIDIMQKIERYGIVCECIEQPIKASDKKGLKKIKEAIETPLLADEAVFTLDDARLILEEDMADMINIKLAKCGGISEAIKLAKLCEEFEKKCMIGCMLEGPIGIIASLHFASLFPDTITMIDLDGVALLKENPQNSQVVFNESNIHLSDAIGLGITYKD